MITLRKVPLLLALCTLFWTSAADAAKPPRRLDVQCTDREVRVRHATAGGEVILIGYELTTFQDAPLYRRVWRGAIAGGDGTIAIDLRRDVAPVSMWVAFDVATGAYGSVTARSLKLRESDLPPQALKRGAGGKVEKIETRVDQIYSFVLRPGVGYWEAGAGDGAEGDADGMLNGRIDFSPKGLRKIGRSAKDFDDLRDGDILAVFVPRQMGYFITEVKK